MSTEAGPKDVTSDIKKEKLHNLNKSQLRQLAELLYWVPPDGGRGWLCVLACFISFGLIVAMSRSFGVMYNDILEAFPGTKHVEVAMMPSMVVTLVTGLGAVAGAFTVAFSVRKVAFIGGLFAGTGVGLNYFAMNVYYMQFSYAIAGIGAGLACNSGLMIVGKYFRKHKTQAMGFSLSGTAIGSMIQPPLLQFLVKKYGFRGALLIQGGLLYNVCVGALFYMDPVSKSDIMKLEAKLADDEVYRQEVIQKFTPTHKPNACFRWTDRHLYIDLALFYSPLFVIIIISVFFLTIGYPQTLTFIPKHAMNLGYSELQAGLLLPISSAGDLVGRIINGYIFDKKYISKTSGYIGSTFLVGFSVLGFAYFDDYIVISICAVIFGYFAGSAFILIPIMLMDNHGAQKLSSSLGLARTSMGLSCLLGPLIAGIIADATGNFVGSFIALGGLTIVSGLVACCIIPFKIRRKKEAQKDSLTSVLRSVDAH